MRRSALKTSIIAIGALIPALIVGVAGKAISQQRPISVSDWLKAERNNANMQRAVEEYERAQFNSVPPQQQRYPQPAQRAQVQVPNAQAPRQWTPPADQQAQVTPPAGGELPQRENEQNTYQVPDDALEKIDKQVEELGGGPGNSSLGFYVAANIGLPFVSNVEIQTGTSSTDIDLSLLAIRVGGVLGYKFTNGLSLELDGTHQYVEAENVSTNFTILSLIPTARMDFGRGQGISPYISAGLGPAYYSANDVNIVSSSASPSDSDLVMAYQVGVGFTYPYSNKTSIDFGYRYFGTTDADLKLTTIEDTGDFSSHSLMVGIKHQL